MPTAPYSVKAHPLNGGDAQHGFTPCKTSPDTAREEGEKAGPSLRSSTMRAMASP